MAILVVGSVALDSVKTPFGQVEDALGGSATFFSISASFFTKVNLVAVVGTDFPKKCIELFNNHAIDITGLEIKKGKTFRWKGFYTYELNTAHTISTHLNVFSTFQPKIPMLYRNIKNIFLANIDPDLQHNVLTQLKDSHFIACDSMNYWIEKKRKSLFKLFKNVNLVLLNENEARQFSSESNLKAATRYIMSKGPRLVIIKSAEAGSILFTKDFIYRAPAYLCENVLDPTGAGDSFAGGLMGYISKCQKLNRFHLCKAIAYGTVLASYAIEDFSIYRLLRLKVSDIKNRLQEYHEMISTI